MAEQLAIGQGPLEPWIFAATAACMVAAVLFVTWRTDRRSGTRRLPLTIVSCVLFATAVGLWVASQLDTEGGKGWLRASNWAFGIWLVWIVLRNCVRFERSRPLEATPARLVGVLLADRRWNEALALGNALVAESPEDPFARLWTAAALAHSSPAEEARAMLDTVDVRPLTPAEKEVHADIPGRLAARKPPLAPWVSPGMAAIGGLMAGAWLTEKLGTGTTGQALVPLGVAALACALVVSLRRVRRERDRKGRLGRTSPVVELVMRTLIGASRPDLAMRVGETRLRLCAADDGVAAVLDQARNAGSRVK